MSETGHGERLELQFEAACALPDTACATQFDSADPHPAAVLLAPACPDFASPAPSASATSPCYPARYAWDELLPRVFEIYVLTCPTCGSPPQMAFGFWWRGGVAAGAEPNPGSAQVRSSST